MKNDKAILHCGHKPSLHEGFTTGYGFDSEGRKHCYECCAKLEKEYMISKGKTSLYLLIDSNEVIDWAGSLRFKTGLIRKGNHNWAGVRYDTWFTGPDGYVWWGVQYGDFTQIIHCKRTKEKA